MLTVIRGSSRAAARWAGRDWVARPRGDGAGEEAGPLDRAFAGSEALGRALGIGRRAGGLGLGAGTNAALHEAQQAAVRAVARRRADLDLGADRGGRRAPARRLGVKLVAVERDAQLLAHLELVERVAVGVVVGVADGAMAYPRHGLPPSVPQGLKRFVAPRPQGSCRALRLSWLYGGNLERPEAARGHQRGDAWLRLAGATATVRRHPTGPPPRRGGPDS